MFIVAFSTHDMLLFFLKGANEMSEAKKRLTITMSQNIYKDLERLAKEKGLSKSALITIAIQNYKKGQINA